MRIGDGVLRKNLFSLQKRDASNRSSYKSNCSQKQQYLERTLRLKALRKSSSLKKVAVPKVILANAIVYNCSSETLAILHE